MRKSRFFSYIFGFIICSAINANASEPAKSTPPSAFAVQGPETSEMAIIDLIAADFFENTLRRAQSFTIEAQTSLTYQNLSEAERRQFRFRRRGIWRELNDDQRLALRSVKLPRYVNLSETQKDPFRKIALDQLTGGGVTSQALASASETEI